MPSPRELTLLPSSRDLALVLVEHDHPTRAALHGALAAAGWRTIHTAGDATDGLRLVRALAHERLLVLLDLDLADNAALDFLTTLRADDELHSVLCVALTAGGDASICTAAYGHHVAGTLHKPDDADAVKCRALASALHGYWSRVEFPGR